MSEYKVVQNAQFSPTKCAFCGSHGGPFIDTHTEYHGYGHVYICAGSIETPGCVVQMARMVGCLDAAQAAEVAVHTAELLDEIERLEIRLAQVAASKEIKVSDLLAVFPEIAPVVPTYEEIVPPEMVAETIGY